jgi:hypothetical protein
MERVIKAQLRQKQHKSWFEEKLSLFSKKRSRMNCNVYKIETLLMQVIWAMWNVEIVGISGTRRGNVGR